MSKREIEQKELKTVLGKDITTKNPIFSPEHIQEFHALFSLYCDPRQRRADCRDMLQTAQTLGLDKKYEIVFKLIMDINDSTGGQPLDFEGFVKELTNRLVRSSLFRDLLSMKKEDIRTSDSLMSLLKMSLLLMT
jgi:Ca2+-binding EF-hand superfamily protein